MDKKIQTYSNDQITVTFDPNICQHAAVCVNTLGKVFNVKNRPWIDVNGASKEEIVALIDKCPSGALKYEVAGAALTVESSPEVEVEIVPNGPLRLKGKCVVKDADGNVLREADKMSLCRCGASKMKPFCDGSHKAIEFEG